MQDHKSLCAAVTICSTLVNLQTHIPQTNRLHAFQPRYRQSSNEVGDGLQY